MIIADGIVCRIPTEYAVKLEKLYCSVAYPVSSADSQTWAAWANALVTAIAVIVAAFAWNESKKANDTATAQLRTGIQAVETQIKAQTDLSFRESELEQFRLYMENLISFANKSPDIPHEHSDVMRTFESNPDAANTAKHISDGEFEALKGETMIRWASWSMYLSRTDRELRDATSRWHSAFSDLATNLRSDVSAFYMVPIRDSNLHERRMRQASINANHQHLLDSVGQYVATMQELIAVPERSSHLRDGIIHNLPGPAPSKFVIQ